MDTKIINFVEVGPTVRKGVSVSGLDSRPLSSALRTCPAPNGSVDAPFEVWRTGVRRAVLDAIAEFVTERCHVDLEGCGVDIARDVLTDFVSGGKCVRSTFVQLGWMCGDAPDADRPAAIRAAASFELLHIFALLQDDVMDGSLLRRGRPAAHVRFADWHRARGFTGPADRFGASAAVLLGDLCLVWSEQLLRGCGLDAAALDRAWPRYDAMRTELAIGQFADLVNDAGELPTLDAVLDVARRKSGNYTVRRPLEIGAELAGCGDRQLGLLGRYGAAVGEAFQLRDDLLGIFGTSSDTGKPVGGDLAEHKATSVVVAAHEMADPALRRQLTALMAEPDLSDADLAHWRTLISATGAVQRVEQLIADRLALALQWVDAAHFDGPVQTALVDMAKACAQRAA
jgi:geranylgeranyl diphosphate synthase, type I